MGHKQKPLSEQLEDAYVKAALLKYEEQEARALRELDAGLQCQPDSQPPPLDDQLLRRFKQAEKTRHTLRRFITVAAAVIVLLALTLVAFGDGIFHFLSSSQDKYRSISNGPVQLEGHAYTDWTGLYMPSYIPGGYNYTPPIAAAGHITIIQYKNDAGGVITFSQYRDSTQIELDDENADRIEQPDISGQKGFLVQKDGTYNLVWGSNPLFLLTGSCDEKELIKMARSVAVSK